VTPAGRPSGAPPPPRLWGENLWTNANLGENLPGVVTPLSASVLCVALDTAFLRSFRRLLPGLPRDTPFLGRFRGRLYLNAAVMQWIPWRALGVPPAESNASFGGRQPAAFEPPEVGPAMRVGWALRRLLVGIGLLASLTSAPRAYRKVTRLLERRPETFETAGDLDLVRLLFDYRPAAEGAVLPFLDVSTASNAFLGALLAQGRRWLGEADGLAMRLVADAGGITSAEHAERLRDLAAACQREPEARAFIARFAGPGEEAGAPGEWRSGFGDGEAARLAAEFLRDFGHRAVRELEMAEPRWAEDPTFLWREVAALTGAPTDPGRGAATRRLAWQEVRARLRRQNVMLAPFRELALRALTSVYGRAARLREAGKSLLVKLVVYRPLILEAGRRLAAKGRLRDPADVFYLERAELIEALLGEASGSDVATLAAERRRRHAAWESDAPPDFFAGDAPPGATRCPPAAARRLEGLAVSAGVVEGIARVLRSPAEGYRLRAGEVLVATHADPAWTPLFLRAAGLALEKGGLLSHSSIVAREYGLPAVANIAGATHWIPDGARVRVDGNRGCVEVLNGAQLAGKQKTGSPSGSR